MPPQIQKCSLQRGWHMGLENGIKGLGVTFLATLERERERLQNGLMNIDPLDEYRSNDSYRLMNKKYENGTPF